MIYKFAIRTHEPYDPAVAAARVQLGLADVTRWRDIYLEVERSLTSAEIEQICSSLANGFTETAALAGPLAAGREVQVAYQRGIVDNENDSLVDLCRLLEISATAGKVATTFASSDPRLAQLVREHYCNPNIEEVHTAEPNYGTLQPAGHYEPMRTFDLRGLSDTQLEALGRAEGRNLNLRQMRQIRTIQLETAAPHVTDVLLEAMDARWSDHCSHTTWKSLGGLLKRLIRAAEATQNPNIVSMFHDNAGVWDFYDGWCLAFKAETHNGPSAISAYFGQLTKLGGVLRDVLGTGQGANPIGVFEYTATGVIGTPSPIPGRPSPQQIAHETIRAVKEYGNTFGVPMMSSHMTQHPAYRAKPFALGGCIGLLPKKFAQRGTPQPGDMLVLIGGLTGNDGIHGASASSAGSEMDTASVQIGSPLEEVKFCQAIVELRDAGCVRAVTDLGAAGLNSAVGEMGEACGVWLNTALVPLKTKGLAMWRILLSESQERMLLAIPPEQLTAAREILARHLVRGTVVGRFAQTGRYTVVYNSALSEGDVAALDRTKLPMEGEVGIDTPYGLLNDEPEPRVPSPQPQASVSSTWPTLTRDDLPPLLAQIVSDPELADQSLAGRQYDSSVQGIASYGPYRGVGLQTCPISNSSSKSRAGLEAYPTTSYWACQPLYGQPQAAVFTTAFNPWLFEANPQLAARQCFFEALTKQVLAGVKLQDIALCDNFYTPHKLFGGDHWLVAMVDELASLVELFGTPLISGKDSSAGSTDTPEGIISVPPAVFISALGKVPDAAKLLPNDWQAAGNLLVRIGPDCSSLAGTVVDRVFSGPLSPWERARERVSLSGSLNKLRPHPGPLPDGEGGRTETRANDVDDLSPRTQREFLASLESLPHGLLQSGVPIGPGGMLAVMFRGVLSSALGVELMYQPDGFAEFFKEHRCGAIAEVQESRIGELPAALRPQVVGRLLDEPRAIRIQGTNILTEAAIEAWRSSYANQLASSIEQRAASSNS